MSLASIVVLYTLTMLTIAHADRGRPTLKDDERFRNGLVTFITSQGGAVVFEGGRCKCFEHAYFRGVNFLVP